ncbi:MAG: Ig-like domain-containing protein, partial [Saprospiraceae bacterium]|nr:Ig-like domain-containing protein [Saprospiraceae bacterium]
FDGVTFDYVTINYDGASGAEDWTVTYDGPAGNLDSAAAMAQDAYGNVYVTGISDGGSTGYDFATVKYQVQEPPAASPESYTINEDTPLVVGAPGVLGNDIDTDNDPLAAILDSDAGHGTLVLNSDGSFSYSPGPDYCGPEGFSYHANDGLDDSNVVAVTVDVTCINDSPLVAADEASVTVDEGTTASNSGTISDAEGDPVILAASEGAVTDNGDGTWSWSFATIDGPSDSQTVTVTADDGQGGISQAQFSLTVNNVSPAIEFIALPADPVSINDQPISVGVSFSDPGTADIHEVAWDWGDGTTDSLSSAPNPVTYTHTYTETGVYLISVTVADDDGGSTSSPQAFVVIYDPDGGFVTGGGWIWSEPGWCQLDELCNDAEGIANFGFVSKYKKGLSVPIGNTQFNFSAGGLNFLSEDYDWLVVNQGGANAQFKGTGAINGAPAPTGEAYKFMIWASDRDPGETDTLRIKIWYEDGGEIIIYENGFG